MQVPTQLEAIPSIQKSTLLLLLKFQRQKPRQGTGSSPVQADCHHRIHDPQKEGGLSPFLHRGIQAHGSREKAQEKNQGMLCDLAKNRFGAEMVKFLNRSNPAMVRHKCKGKLAKTTSSEMRSRTTTTSEHIYRFVSFLPVLKAKVWLPSSVILLFFPAGRSSADGMPRHQQRISCCVHRHARFSLSILKSTTAQWLH